MLFTLYHISFAAALLCFLYHTSVHVLGHYGKIKEGEAVHVSIGIAMFIGWFSYFFMAFSDSAPFDIFPFNLAGLAILITGILLFIVSHGKVHKRMHHGEGGLVMDGIYRYTRHPMYLGEIMMLLGAPVFTQGLTTLTLSALFIAQILVWRYLEEKELMEEFPDYKDYKKRTLF
jgi:protein-S-isoprenylcysteine O-methyltransferase Ste14